MNILEAMQTPEIFGEAFIGESWEAWRSVLSGAFAIPMDGDRLAKFKELAGDREPPCKRVSRLSVIAGRRSAKTHTAAGAAVYLATVGAAIEGLTEKLSPGERGVIALLATDRSQAKVALGYINGLIDQSPALSGMVEKRGAEAIRLNNRISIEVSTSNYRAIRGRTLLAVILDELCFFRDSETSASNDAEIVRAAIPGLATTGGMLIAISSPWAKRGWLYEQYRKHYGTNNDDVLVIKGPTTAFNPTLPQSVIDEALADDPEAAKTEWLAEFREGISNFLDRTVVDSCTRSRPLVVPPSSGIRYCGFVDPAGGGQSANADQFTMAIGYKNDDSVVVCGVYGRKGSPAEIVKEYSEILKGYGIKEVHSDRYAGSWPADEFQKNGIRLLHTDKNRSQLYTEVLPMFNTGRIEIPADPHLINQFCSLERRVGRNADIIDHAPGSHDDLANSVAGLARHALSSTTWTRPIEVIFPGQQPTTTRKPGIPYGH